MHQIQRALPSGHRNVAGALVLNKVDAREETIRSCTLLCPASLPIPDQLSKASCTSVHVITSSHVLLR